MAEIRGFLVVRHFRGEPSSHVLRYRSGKLVASGRGLAFWFCPMSTSIAEVPIDDRELSFLFHGRSSDFQDITAQGVVTYRIVDATTVSDRIDFCIDLRRGVHLRQPLEKLSFLLTQLAQQLALEYISTTSVREILKEGHEQIRSKIDAGLTVDEGLSTLGLEIVSVRVSSVRPTPDLEKALEMPTLEKIQEHADEASFARRALAVENERAIQENELSNQIELARKEEQLIGQRGQNEKRRAIDLTEAERISAAGQAERTGIQAKARAESLRLVEGAQVESERERMEVYNKVSQEVLLGLAARELASKLQRIEHLNVTPELLGPMLTRLLSAGTERLEAKG